MKSLSDAALIGFHWSQGVAYITEDGYFKSGQGTLATTDGH